MIDFQLSEGVQTMQAMVHAVAEQAMRPIARECDENSEVPADFFEQVHSLGLLSTAIPEAYGGGGEARSPKNSGRSALRCASVP